MFRSRKEALRSLGLDESPVGRKRGSGNSSGKKVKKVAPPPTTKAQATNSPKKSPKKVKTQTYPIGTTFSKLFPDETVSDGERSFQGEIVGYKNGLYKVFYEEDGDEEEMSEGEMAGLMKKKKGKAINGKASNGKTNGKSADGKAVNGKAKPNGKATNGKAKTNDKAKGNPKFPTGGLITKDHYDEEFSMTRPISGTISSYDASSNTYNITFETHQESLPESEVADIFVPRYKRGIDKVSKDGIVGVVGAFDKGKGMYDVHYKNGSEWLTEVEVGEILEGTKKKQKEATTKSNNVMDTTDEEEESDGPVVKPRRRATKKVNYRMDSFSDDEESEDEKPAKKAKKETAASKKKKKSKSKKNDSDSDDFAPGEESEDDVLMNDAISSSEEEEEEVKKPAKKKAAAKTKPKSTSDVEKRTKMSDVDGIRKTLKNNPDYYQLSRAQIKETQSFLDPCGMEATDAIIERLVGHQLDQISGLLVKAFKGTALGSTSNPLVLGTACSGTDAPALALMLNQEQLEARGLGGLFKYEHVFSCEKEPYKQAYLARK